MYTGVIELDALADTIWSRAQNDNFLAVTWQRLVFFTVS